MTKTIRRSTFRHSLANAHDRDRSAAVSSPAAPEAAGPTPSPTATLTVSKKTQTLLDEVKAGFGHFTADFNLLMSSRAELAPRFMRALTAWQAETGGTFIAFVRILDPAMPHARNDYRNHRSYQAALYLQALTTRHAAPAVPAGKQPVAPLQCARPYPGYHPAAHR